MVMSISHSHINIFENRDIHIQTILTISSYLKMNNNVEIYADGHELECCLKLTGLPNTANLKSMKFYGDFAKHIIGNWNNYNKNAFYSQP